MASLYQTSSQLRRVLVFAFLGVILILVVDNLSRILQTPGLLQGGRFSYYSAADNKVKLPKLSMPTLTTGDSSRSSFSKDGVFASFPDTVLVYTIEKPRERLDTVETATTTAQTLGFTSNYTSISSEEISWTNISQTRTLTFNKDKYIWSMRTRYAFDPIAQAQKELLGDIKGYEQVGTSLASRLGFAEKSISEGATVVKYALLGTDGYFTSPLDRNAANYISLDVFRTLTMTRNKTDAELSQVKPQNIPPILRGKVYRYHPQFGSLRGSLHMIISNKAAKVNEDVFELDYINYEYNYTNPGISEIITPDEAWDKVSRGEGRLVRLVLANSDYFAVNQALSVTKYTVNTGQTELGYYEPDPWDGYVYPIYIFRGRVETDKGTANFEFFVDALRRAS